MEHKGEVATTADPLNPCDTSGPGDNMMKQNSSEVYADGQASCTSKAIDKHGISGADATCDVLASIPAVETGEFCHGFAGHNVSIDVSSAKNDHLHVVLMVRMT